MNKQIRTLKIVVPLLLTLILICSYLIRIDPMFMWDIYPEKFFVDGEPVLANLDGYYYLNAAQEIQEGSYSGIESYRAFPDKLSRSPLPSLSSLIIAHFSTITGYSINFVGIFLPVALSLTLFVPLYLWGIQSGGGHIMGLTASAFGLTSSIFVNRTYLGFLDTDCLNPTLALLAAYFVYRFFSDKSFHRKLNFLALFFLMYVVFLMWWDQAPSAVLFFCFCPFLLGICLYWIQAPRFYSIIILISSTVAFFTPLLINDYSVLKTFKQGLGVINYISKQENYSYPNVGQTITEQVPLNLEGVVSGTTNSWTLFILGIIGLALLVIKNKRVFIFLLPILAIGIFSLTFAMRFLIFLSPLIALGIGYFFSNIYSMAPTYKNVSTKPAFTILVIGFTIFFLFKNVNQGISRMPNVSAETISGMHQLRSLTPPQSLIWSWWDAGHPLVYWARRNTVNDGMVHDGARNSFTAKPLFTDDYRFAANYMYFYATHGKAGLSTFISECDSINLNATEVLQVVLKNGPNKVADILPQFPSRNLDELQNFFFPSKTKPVYLFLSLKTLLSSQLIYWYGSWDPEVRSGDPTTPMLYFDKVTFDESDRLEMNNFTIDYNNGLAKISSMFSKPIELNYIFTTNDSTTSHLNFPQNYTEKIKIPPLPIFNLKGSFSKMVATKGQISLELSSTHKIAIIQDSKQANSIINRLFWRIDDYHEKYFKPVELNTPHYQIWQVIPDKKSH